MDANDGEAGIQTDTEKYTVALSLLRESDFSGAIAVAKENLSNDNLTLYLFIKNCLLVAYAEKDWQEAEVLHRLPCSGSPAHMNSEISLRCGILLEPNERALHPRR